MQHVIAWRFWLFLLNRGQGVIGSNRVIKLSLLPSVMNTSLFSRFHPISKIHWIFMFPSRWTIRTNCFSLFALGNWLGHFLLFIFHFSTGMCKTIHVTLQTNKTNLIIIALCWLYMWTFIMLNPDHEYLFSFLITSYFLFIYSCFCYHTSAELEGE